MAAFDFSEIMDIMLVLTVNIHRFADGYNGDLNLYDALMLDI